MAVPTHKRRHIFARGLRETLQKFFYSGRCPVEARKIKIAAFAESLRAQPAFQHTDKLSAFFIDRRRVKIIDLQIALWPHRVGERAIIFRKLPRSQGANIFDPLHGRPALIGRELLIAEYGETFFEAKLKPIPAGNAVARPVVEIFMGDNGLDPFKIHIGCCRGVCEQEGAIEDIQTFIFHRAEIEIAHSHDHEPVEIIFPTKGVFIPTHRPLQRVHGIFRL